MSQLPRPSRLWLFTAPLLAVLVGAVAVISAMRVPYVVLAPGSARSVEPRHRTADPPSVGRSA